VLAVVAALVVFRGTLAYFFAQDDFTGLARARGIIPALQGPWRYLSGQLYFDVMALTAGTSALPYRLVSLLAHATTVALVFVRCSRRVALPAAAALGAIFFGTHPSLFTALYSVSGIGEILAGLLAVTTLLLVARGDRGRWFAVPAFAASLLCKESTVLLPLGAALVAARSRAPRRFAVPIALAIVSAIALATFVWRDTFGVRAGVETLSPYAVRFGRPALDNLLSYLGWTARIALPWVHSFADAVEGGVFADGIVLAAVWLAGCAVPALRQRGWVEGGVLWLLLIAPVLPLAHHTYHYYLYSPLTGAALCVAAAADAVADWVSRRFGARRLVASAVVGALALLVTVNGALLVHRIETYPFVDPELRSDPTVDRARIARNAIADLEGSAMPPGVSLWFWSPASIARGKSAGADTTQETYWETNVRTALYDDLAVRVMLPTVREVRFVRTFELVGDSVRYAVYLPNGHLKVGAPSELATVLGLRPKSEPAPE